MIPAPWYMVDPGVIDKLIQVMFDSDVDQGSIKASSDIHLVHLHYTMNDLLA